MTGPVPLVTYDEFKGEYGQLGAWKAPAGSFTGINVLRYLDGSIGPRVAPKALTITGLPSGDVLAMGTGGDGSADRVWFVVGTTTYGFDPGNAASQAVVTYTGALTTAPTAGQPAPSVVVSTKSYFFNRADGKLYRIDHVANTVTAVVTITGGAASAGSIVAYGERLAIAVADNNRVYFSDAGLPESWPVANYFDVGDLATGITGLYAQRTHLAISKGAGIQNGQWWICTGTLGVDQVLRKATLGLAPSASDVGVVDGDGMVQFIASDRAPGEFSGSIPTARRHLSDGPGSLLRSFAIPLRTPGDIAHIGVVGNEGFAILARVDRVWTRHKFSDFAPGTYPIPKGLAATWPSGDRIVFAALGRAQSGFHCWSLYNDSPIPRSAINGDVLPAGVDASFTLPEWLAPNNHEVAVAAVLVDFRTFAVGSGTCTWTLTTTPVRVHEASAGTTQTFGFSVAAPGTSGNRRKLVKLGIEDAGGFVLAFTGLRGVAIQRVTVFGTTRPQPGLG